MTDRQGFEGLDSCVHCGFCLQACPTFLATGDEADSPRGRIELMRGLEAGELTPGDPGVATHLDRCLGCRGCEPVCPSGVRYGQGLEAARALLADRRGVPFLVRAALSAMTTAGASRVVYALARLVRATGLPRRLAGWGRVRFAMGMLGASAPKVGGRRWRSVKVAGGLSRPNLPQPPLTSQTSPVLLFRGCIMDGLFSHVHDATIRTLELNGYTVEEVPAQVCCGALHAHAGLRSEARRLARANVVAFGTGDQPVVVNSAGCGAMLKDYAHLVDDATNPAGAGARAGGGAKFAARVRDVSELLAERGPRPGAPLDTTVAYDPPCHLLHAQRIVDPPERVLRAIPVLRLTSMPDAAQCCGSAGLFTLVEPEMSRAVLAPKIASLAQARPQVVATGNPGCLMQLGAGLAAAGVAATVRHPVELLDESYRAAGYYA